MASSPVNILMELLEFNRLLVAGVALIFCNLLTVLCWLVEKLFSKEFVANSIFAVAADFPWNILPANFVISPPLAVPSAVDLVNGEVTLWLGMQILSGERTKPGLQTQV